ncbi:MAG TPA: PAS domain S-box protein [Syntrophorhabdaceae bacterium]|nr:PAS domain S-box protein [Syntrophorhabdaceae bacterium]HQM80101.1 PAS domain S-box protein [Syntrophorhabdaceae bacterium]
MKNQKSTILHHKSIRVLIVEDSEDDTLLLLNLLRRSGYEVVHERVEKEEAMRAALLDRQWDIILCDYRLPQFDGMRALQLIKDMNIDIPFIIVSGAIGEETAVECMKAGAHDYVLKNNLTRLIPAIEREIQGVAIREERRRIKAELSNLALIVQNSNDMISLANPVGTMIFINNAMSKRLGIDRNVVGRYHIVDLFFSDYKELFRKMAMPELKRSGLWRGDVQYYDTRTGLAVEAHASLFTINDTDTGELRYIANISTDIGERKRFEKDIIHLASFPQFTPVLIVEIGQGDAVTYVNPATQKALAEMGEQDAGLFIPQDIHEMAGKGAVSEQGEIEREVPIHGRTYLEKICFFPIFNVIRIYAYDITARTQAEEKMRRSEMYYRLLFENSGEAILLTAPDGSIYSANPEACRMLQRSEAEICSLGRGCVMDSSDPRLPAALEERERTGRFKRELTCMRSDGRKFPCEISSVVFKDHDGQYRTVTTIHDLTERKRMEEILRAQAQTIATIANNVPALVAYVDRDGYYRFANERYEEWFGIPAGEIIGRHYREVLGLDAYDKIQSYVGQVFSGKQVSFEERVPYAKGGERWISAQYVPDFDDEGKVQGYFGLVTDITKRKVVEEQLSRSMKQFENMVRNVPGIIYRFALHPDGSMSFPYISENACKLGLAPHEVMKDAQKLIDAISSDDLPGLMETIRESARSLRTWQWEGRFIVAGEERWYRGISQPGKLPDGTVEWDGLITDVTEERKSLERLKELQRFSLSTINALTAHIAVLDESGTIIAVNRSWREFADKNPPVTQNVCEGANYLMICDNAKGEDEVQAFAFSEGIRSVIRGEKEWFILDYPCHSPDERRWFTGRVTRFSGPGPVRIVVAHENITDRKLTEEKIGQKEADIKSILDNSKDFIVRFDRGLRHLFVNKALSDATGISYDEYVGKTNEELGMPEDLCRFWNENLMKVFKTGRTNTFEFDFTTRDGRISSFQAKVVPELNNEGLVETIISVVRDMTEKKKIEAKIRRAQERLKALAKKVTESEETERKRITRELHDTLGQSLTAIGINLNIIQSKLPEELHSAVMPHLNDALTLIDESAEHVRRLVFDLRVPVLDDYGLLAAVEWFAKRCSGKTGIIFLLKGGGSYRRLSANIELEVFRIVQETFNNIIRHSNATQVIITFEESEKGTLISVEDNGIGFDYKKVIRYNKQKDFRSWGLLNMIERTKMFGGRLYIESQPGSGTKVMIKVSKRT